MTDDQTVEKPNPKLAAALALARYGFNVFPLISNDKRPLIENWQNLATNDLMQIKIWWSTQPDSNIGIATENLLVIDVDPRNGGDATFRALFEAQHLVGEEFPPTLAAGTRAGGTHMFYWLPPHTLVRGGANKLGDGVDIKSHGGYVVGAGSTIDGKPYFWKAGYEPDKIDFKEAPLWLITKCNAAKPKSADASKTIVEEDETALQLATDYVRSQAPEAIQGGRDNTAYTVAARLYDFGVSRETAQELLSEWNESYCHPTLENDAIERIAWSAQRNRENAIGSAHPNAPGFEPQQINAQVETQTKRPRLYRLTYKQAADQALDNSGEPLIEGLLDRNAMSVWYGESNSGKTFVMLDAAWHIAAGRAWAGKTTRKGAVVYVAAEGGQGILKRVRALRQRYEDAGEVPLYLVPCAVDLLRPDADLKPLAAEIKAVEAEAGKVELIVIDTLSRAIAGGNENDSQDMGVFVAHLDALRQGLKAHVAIVHHTGKDKAKGARGHSLLRAATDTEIEIDQRTLSVTKQRDMEGEVALPFGLKPIRLGVSKTGAEITSCTVEMGRPGDAPFERIPLQPHLAEFLQSIREYVETGRAGEEAKFTTAPLTVGMDALEEMGLRHSSGKPLPRQTLQARLAELTEKGWLRKTQRGRWQFTNN